MSLWIEHAHQSFARSGEDVCADVVRTLQTEERFFALLASGSRGGVEGMEQAARVADEVTAALRQGTPPDAAMEAVQGTHGLKQSAVSLSILQVEGGHEAFIIECDAPPLFLVQDGQPVLLPVVEEVLLGRLVRRCRFSLQDGDHLAMVSEGFLRPRGWRWGWPDIAVAVRRWTDTGCDADELLGALLRTYRRLNPDPPQQDVTVVAMHVRPMRSATVWTGPPADAGQDEAALGRLMAEQDARIICGDTTAQIAARLLGAELEMEPRPADGADGEHPWDKVPPVSRMDGVSLITEGLVTLRKAREYMREAKRVHDLPRSRDAVTHLARALLTADRVHFIIGLAVNPQQVDESGAPLRKGVVEDLMHDLEARGKLVSVEYN